MQDYLGTLIAHEARTWLGTPFAHQGRSAAGIDCLGLLIMVANALDLADKHGTPLSTHDRSDYTKSPKGEQLSAALEHTLLVIPPEEMQQGDIALCTFDHTPQHLALIGTYHQGGQSLIHAYAPARRVVEHALDASWRKRITTCYRVPASCQTILREV